MGDNTDIEINLNDDNNEIEINREQIIYTGISEERLEEIEGDIDNLEKVAGIDVETFSTSSTYAVGDTVVKDKKIYKCIVAVTTAGAWNANNWTEVSIRDLIEDTNDKIDDLDSDVIKEVKLNGETLPKTGNSVNVNGVEVISNKVTEIDEESTDTEYPSAKCVYDNFVSDRERITQLETDKALLEDLFPTDNAEGETIDIDDSAKYYFKEFAPEGQTEQASTEGYNLLDLPESFNETTAGVQTSLENNIITLKPVANVTSGGSHISLKSSYTIQSGDYLHFGNDAISSQILFQFGSSINTGTFNTLNKIVSLENWVGTTITEVYFYHSNQYDTTIHLQPMIIHNVSTVTPFEPCSGGIPGPNPSYPFPINNVTGENKIKVRDNNLFDMSVWNKNNITVNRGTLVSKDNNSITITSTANDCYTNTYNADDFSIKVEPNTTYIMSFKKRNSTQGNCYIFYYRGINRGFISMLNSELSKFSFTTPVNAEYIRIRFGIESAGLTETFYDVSIKKSSTSIDDEYQTPQTVTFPLSEGQYMAKGDYLADNGIHHVRGKYVFTGNETIASYQVSTYAFQVNLPAIQIFYNNNEKTVLCNALQAEHANNIFSKRDESGNNIISSYTNGFLFMINNYTTVENIKSYLQTQYTNGTPVIAQYKLATEIIEPYTQAQQEAYNEIQKLMSYKGITHISQENDNLPFNLKVVYRKDYSTEISEIKQAIVALGGVI